MAELDDKDRDMSQLIDEKCVWCDKLRADHPYSTMHPFESLTLLKGHIGKLYETLITVDPIEPAALQAARLIKRLREHERKSFEFVEKLGRLFGWRTDFASGGLTLTECGDDAIKRIQALQAPVPMILTCPSCVSRHIDEGEFATKPHHTHACQSCGMVWRPALVATVGVQFLPGFKGGVAS